MTITQDARRCPATRGNGAPLAGGSRSSLASTQLTQAAAFAAMARSGMPLLPTFGAEVALVAALSEPGPIMRALADLRAAARGIWRRKRQLHRIAWHSALFLLTVRAAFPWPLRVLAVIGAIQIPVLPTDEIAAAAAGVWLFCRYRPLARVIWRAAVMEVAR